MSKTKYAILGLLAEEPHTGYEIKQIIDIRFRFFWSESYGQIYPEIRKLHQDELIEVIDRLDAPRNRQKYTITEKGKLELKKWMSEPVDTEVIRLEFLLKMYFAEHADKEVLLKHINQYIDQHSMDLFQLQMFEKELQTVPDPYQNHQYILNVIRFGINANKAYISSCEMMKQQIGVKQ